MCCIIHYKSCTYPNLEDHCVDDAANDGDKVKNVPWILKEVLQMAIYGFKEENQLVRTNTFTKNSFPKNN